MSDKVCRLHSNNMIKAEEKKIHCLYLIWSLVGSKSFVFAEREIHWLCLNWLPVGRKYFVCVVTMRQITQTDVLIQDVS